MSCLFIEGILLSTISNGMWKVMDLWITQYFSPPTPHTPSTYLSPTVWVWKLDWLIVGKGNSKSALAGVFQALQTRSYKLLVWTCLAFLMAFFFFFFFPSIFFLGKSKSGKGRSNNSQLIIVCVFAVPLILLNTVNIFYLYKLVQLLVSPQPSEHSAQMNSPV